MPCYTPLEGFRKRGGGITWSPRDGYTDLVVQVPCGQCVGCRLERSRQWATRIMHETKMHDDSAFVTLTYSDEHLPKDLSLRKSDFQKFIKRLRHTVDNKVSYFHCGEYGETNGRPHYHAILFGIRFRDMVLHSRNGRGDRVYTSQTLEDVWQLGFATVGEVTFESAAYVARYCLKKVTGDLAAEHYRRVSPDGEVYYLEPEYATMSLKPGIGLKWFESFSKEVEERDGVVVDGALRKAPRYYDKLRGKEAMKVVKRKRKFAALEHAADQTPERLEVRRTVKEAQLKALKRSL